MQHLRVARTHVLLGRGPIYFLIFQANVRVFCVLHLTECFFRNNHAIFVKVSYKLFWQRNNFALMKS